jgi:hypothetical protein
MPLPHWQPHDGRRSALSLRITVKSSLLAVVPTTLLAVFLLMPGDLWAQEGGQRHDNTVVCRALNIFGFEAESEKAKRYIGATTHDIGKVSVFVSVARGRKFFASNYVSPGFDHPTKIATDETDVDLLTITYNLIFAGEPSKSQDVRMFRRSFSANVHFYIEASALDNPLFTAFDFDDPANVEIVAPDGESHPAVGVLSSPGHVGSWLVQSEGVLVPANSFSESTDLSQHYIAISRVVVVNANANTREKINEKDSSRRVTFLDDTVAQPFLGDIASVSDGVIVVRDGPTGTQPRSEAQGAWTKHSEDLARFLADHFDSAVVVSLRGVKPNWNLETVTERLLDTGEIQDERQLLHAISASRPSTTFVLDKHIDTEFGPLLSYSIHDGRNPKVINPDETIGTVTFASKVHLVGSTASAPISVPMERSVPSVPIFTFLAGIGACLVAIILAKSWRRRKPQRE